MREQARKERVRLKKICWAIVLVLMIGFAGTAQAGPVSPDIPYIDENGETQVISDSKLNDLNHLDDTYPELYGEYWYIARGEVTVDKSITVKGIGANLILEDGCVLTVTNKFDEDMPAVIVGASGALNIYGQANGTGQLRATVIGNDKYSAGIGAEGSKPGNGSPAGVVTINGGTIIATGGSAGGAGIGGGGCANTWGNGGRGGIVTINGGTVIATAPGRGAGIGSGGSGSNNSAETEGTITIKNGAKVIATGGSLGGASVGTGARGANPGDEALTTAFSPGNEKTLEAGQGRSVTIKLDRKNYLTLTGTPTYQWQRKSSSMGEWANVGGALDTYADLVISAVAPADAGQYRCVVNREEGSPAVYGLNSTPVTLNVRIEQPELDDLGFDYLEETIIGFLENTKYSISLEGGNAIEYTSDADGEITIDETWFGKELTIDIVGGGYIEPSGDSCKLTVPDRPEKPNGLGTVNTSGAGKSDGKITGTADILQYRLGDQGQWSDCPNGQTEMTGLSAGEYQLRKRAIGKMSFAGKIETVTVWDNILTVTAPGFVPVKEGYQRPSPQAIAIKNNSNTMSATIAEVSLDQASINKFSIKEPNDKEIPDNGISTDWTIQPVGGLGEGTHTGTITVRYTPAPNGPQFMEATAQVEFVVNPADPLPPLPPNPGKSSPKVDPDASSVGITEDGGLEGTMGISGLGGTTLPLRLEIRGKDGKEILLVIENVEGKLDGQGKLVFEALADEIENLPVGDYTVYASSPGNGLNWGFDAVKIGSFSIKPLKWSVPESLTAASGVAYHPVRILDAEEKPGIKVTIENPGAVNVDKDTLRLVGTLQSPPGSNVAKVTFTDRRGTARTCEVTVVPNKYEREAPLRIARKYGVYTSTCALYYDGDNLEVRVFLLNKRRNRPVKYAGDLTLRLYRGDTLIYSKRLDRWKMKQSLQYNNYAIYEITLTPDDLEKVRIEKPYELINGEYQAVLTRTSNVTPALREGQNVVMEANGRNKPQFVMIVGASQEAVEN